MKRQIVIVLACCIIGSQNPLKAQVGFRELDIPGNVNPIYGMTLAPDGKTLAIAPSNGRLLLMDVSSMEQGVETGKLKNQVLWKRLDFSGFRFGSKPVFSAKGKYILLQECNSMRVGVASTKAYKIDYVIVETETGKDVYKGGDVYSVNFLPDEETIMVASEDGLRFIDILSKKVVREKAIEDCEVAAISNDGKLVAVVFDPNKKELKQVESIGNNKKEMRNAKKNKKLINFYNAETLDKLYTINDEVDIIYRLVFSPDDKEIIMYSKNKAMEHINATNAGMAQTFGNFQKTKEQYNLQRIEAKTGIIDRDFYYSTEDFFCDFKINKEKTLFAYTQTPGFFSWKRKLSIYNYNKLNELSYAYLCQGQLGSNNISPINFVFANNDSIIFIGQGLKIIEWNYKRLPDYTSNPEGITPNTLSEAARVQLDTLMKEGSDLRKSIDAFGIKGFYIFDITIHKKGEVATVFAQSDEKTDIKMQNALKDIVRQAKFDLKLPKDMRVKFKYTFDIY